MTAAVTVSTIFSPVVGRDVWQVEPELVPESGLVPPEDCDPGRLEEWDQLGRRGQVQARQLLQHHHDRTQPLAQILSGLHELCTG